ncbi:tRNA (adenine(9)-N(1))-methyltransferase [Saccharolobus shibatae B12]|uniref:tRNA (Adenine(9)-N(1))-methyltransferase n=1 Tax=Saccharolobus shibatae (strain ATCC 51178 / DSM 5389 / JCM 8931 / NBRC 15437 / B12) TaxID=523848 RepID=A0A8F5BQB9_SACSH|nr:tRNA (adenine(9)-N1)-methyltransferase Trm10 [Saccharolobus shibatae]QXJ29523.1 tRNA (adenine(9)-N(1))-methyltransferase [Saccharolobus shibatae B12]
MILGKALARYLTNTLGIETLKISTLKKLFKTGYLQSIAINMLLYDYGISKKHDYGKVTSVEEKIKILKGRGEEITDYVLLKNGEIKISSDIIPKSPQFIIDLGNIDLLQDEEKTSLEQQIQVSIKTIREYLFDYNLKLAHTPDSFKLESRNKIEILNHIPKDNAIVLNPYGDTIANEEIIRNTKFFIIGGIVDKGRRLKNATYDLSRKYGYDELPQVKISLRNSTVGVPDRINSIIEILLKVIVGNNLEEAIISTQSNADKVSRLVRELNMLEKFDYDAIIGLKNWLKIDDKLLKLALKKSKFKTHIS